MPSKSLPAPPPALSQHDAPLLGRPLKICMVVPYDLTPEAGGVKHHAYNLMAALQGLGDEVSLVGPATRAPTAPGVCGFTGVFNVSHNGSDNQLGLLVRPWRVAQYLSRRHFDIVHLHEPQSPLLPNWMAWLTPRVVKVATFHAYDEDGRALWGRRMLGAAIFGCIARAMAVSASAARYAAASWRRPIAVIPNGVCQNVFYPRNSQTPAVVQGGPRRLLFVGRLADARKGVRILLDAYRALVQRQAPVMLTCIGSSDGFGPLPRMPGLTFIDAVTTAALAQHYRDADALVAPASGQESFGMVIAEAMASARPVICSRIEGFMDVVYPAGSMSCTPGDARALAQTIDAFTALPDAACAAMGEANLRAAARFFWTHVVHAVRAEYVAALATRRHAA